MPKIIKDLEKKLLAEAQKQILTSGYSSMTIRSVAKACNVAVGTVYNYFPSKDKLLATYMLADWENCIATICAVSTYSNMPKPVVRCIYDQLHTFSHTHRYVFQDEAAVTAFATVSGQYHALLRSQISAPLRKFCQSDFAADFIAESLLIWTIAETPFDDLYPVIEKLF